MLDPARDAARIRAFFVHPEWSRRGLGKALLARCEVEVRAHGFLACELMATLTGVRLYLACGYIAEEPIDFPLRDGQLIRFVPMRKQVV